MRIELDISEVDIDRITRALDGQYAYTLAEHHEDSGFKRLADLFRGFLKERATWLCDQQPVPKRRKR